jgi:hypothetical protein
MFKGLAARRLYKSFGVKGFMNHLTSLSLFCGAVIPFRFIASPYRLRDHTLRHATLGGTPVNGDQHDPDTT